MAENIVGQQNRESLSLGMSQERDKGSYFDIQGDI